MRKFKRLSNAKNYNGPLIIGNVYNENYRPAEDSRFPYHASVENSVRDYPHLWEEVFDKPKLFKLL